MLERTGCSGLPTLVVNGGRMVENSRASTCALLYSVLLVSVCDLNTYNISQRGLPEQNRLSA